MKENVINGPNLYLKLVFEIDRINKKERYYHIYLNDTNKYIGNCGIRLDENEDNVYLGNIEYEIFSDYRGHYYSREACLLLSQVAYSHNLKSLIITANIKNKGSIKIIESLGAELLKVVKVPKSCKLYKQGDRKIRIYCWNIQNEKERIL